MLFLESKFNREVWDVVHPDFLTKCVDTFQEMTNLRVKPRFVWFYFKLGTNMEQASKIVSQKKLQM